MKYQSAYFLEKLRKISSICHLLNLSIKWYTKYKHTKYNSRKKEKCIHELQTENTYNAMGKFSRCQTHILFSFFPRKIGSYTSCNFSICMKYEILFSTSCKLSSKKTICMKYQIPFSRKKKNQKNISKWNPLEFLPSMLSVKAQQLHKSQA